MSKETFAFQTETKQLLDLMIHSVYSNKDIFLRELISNSSDALDKRRFEAVKDPALLSEEAELHIQIVPDVAGRTLSIVDNGIGMTREEVIEHIGTIAKSGTREFMETLKAAKEASDLSPELIGQFGVGFYSSFMVADRVELVTRRAGSADAVRWESVGDGQYTLEPTDRDEPGTTITLHLKPTDSEDGLHDYTMEWTIREIVKKYSDFVAYPIRMDIERKEIERDEAGKPVEGAVETVKIETVTLNSMKAIWLRDKDEVTLEEYQEFYKHISHDWNEPMKIIQAKIEGVLEYRLLLFIPGHAPFDLFRQETTKGVQLYVKRVFIMDDCEELLPPYLRFMRGVVDSEDLSLNISRELLQQNRHIQRMKKGIIGKVLDTLKQMQKNEAEEYTKFWNEFGKVLKEGLYLDTENRQTLLDLVMFQSTDSPDASTTLRDYVNRMKPEQTEIYFMTARNRKDIENSPHIEAFKDKGYEVLFLIDPVDEIWTQSIYEYDGKKLTSIGQGTVDLGSEEEKKQAETERKEKEETFGSLLERMKLALDEFVKEVRLSSRLVSAPACLVGDVHGMTPQLEQIMRAMNQDMPPVKRILEVNPNHPILQDMQAVYDENPDDALLTNYAQLLYGQAVLAEGGQLTDPGAFSKLVADLMTQAIRKS